MQKTIIGGRGRELLAGVMRIVCHTSGRLRPTAREETSTGVMMDHSM